MKTQTIKLSTFRNTLIGNYKSGYHIIVELDATEGPFTVELPSCEGSEDTQFSFPRTDEVRSFDGVANRVTLEAKLGQKIKNEDTQKVSVGSSPTINTGGLKWVTV